MASCIRRPLPTESQPLQAQILLFHGHCGDELVLSPLPYESLATFSIGRVVNTALDLEIFRACRVRRC